MRKSVAILYFHCTYIANSPMNNASFPKAAAVRASAFTLVEIALALGVISFALIGLIALLPAGLNNFRSSMNASVGAQIYQRIVTDAEQSDFDALLTAAPPSDGSGFAVLPLRYFDDEGNEVVPANPASLTRNEAQKVIYHVHVRASFPGPANVSSDSANCFTSLPAAPGSVRFNPRSSTILTIQVACNPGNQKINEDSTTRLWTSNSLPITAYQAVVTKNQSTIQKTGGS